MEKLFTDLLIVDGDLVSSNGVEKLVDGKASIIQDIKHLIIETQLLITLIGERSAERRQMNINQLINHIETDPRIKPGSVDIEEPELGLYLFRMDTVKGLIDLTIKN